VQTTQALVLYCLTTFCVCVFCWLGNELYEQVNTSSGLKSASALYTHPNTHSPPSVANVEECVALYLHTKPVRFQGFVFS
jgi:hypothetical protein